MMRIALNKPNEPSSAAPRLRWTDQLGEFAPPRRRDLIEHELDGEVMLCDPRNGYTYRMNATTLQVWRLCDGLSTTTQITARQAELYDVEFDTAQDHVEQLVVRFAESDILDAEPLP